LEALDAYELYFLVAAAYLHDLGMVGACPGPPSGSAFEQHKATYLQTHVKATNLQVIADYVRRTHHQRSEEYILANGHRLGLGTNSSEWAIVGRIARGHRSDSLRDKLQYGPVFFGSNTPVHRDLLAAYLRLADELDITALRTPALAFEDVDETNQVALRHWRTHAGTVGVGTAGSDIVINGRCTDYDVHLFLLDAERKVQTELDELRTSLPSAYPLLSGQIIQDPVPYRLVRAQIEAVGYKAWNLRFELDSTRITEILASQTFYGGRSAAVRELLQNAVDAVRLRARLAPQAQPFSPQIEFALAVGPDGRRLKVRDNGIGISEDVLRRHLGHVGRSYYRSSEFDQLRSGLTPIGHFGIGVLSYFMIADHVSITTRPPGGDCLRIDIRGPGEYFKVTVDDSRWVGTEVVLTLRDDFDDSLVNLVWHYAACLEFPVSVVEADSEIQIDGNPQLTVDWRTPLLEWGRHLSSNRIHRFDARTYLAQYHAHVYKAQFDDLRVSLALVSPRVDGDQVSPRFDLHGYGSQSLKLCNQGVLIKTDRDFGLSYAQGERSAADCFNLGVYGIINFHRHPEGLLATRNDLAATRWLQDVERRVRLCVASAIGEVAGEVQAARQHSLATKRAYLHGLLVDNVSSGVSTKSWDDRHKPDYIAKDVYQLRFSLDPNLTRALVEAYGTTYPVASKHGRSAYFRTLEERLRAGDVSSIYCCMPDPMYPNFAGFCDLEHGGNATLLLDDSREFDLISRFCALAGFGGSVRFLTGWDLWQLAGAQLVLCKSPRALPRRMAVVRWHHASNGVPIQATDSDLVSHRDAIRGVHTSPTARDILYMVNADSVLGKWLTTREIRQQDWQAVRNLLSFVVSTSRIETMFMRSGEKAMFDHLVEAVSRGSGFPRLTWRRTKAGLRIELPRPVPPKRGQGGGSGFMLAGFDAWARSQTRGWPPFVEYHQPKWWDSVLEEDGQPRSPEGKKPGAKPADLEPVAAEQHAEQ
jgi:hypothetical protein